MTFSGNNTLPPSPFRSSEAGVPSLSAWPFPSPAQEHRQPQLTSLPRLPAACLGSSKELPVSLQMCEAGDSHSGETHPKPSRLLGVMLSLSNCAWPHTWCCAKALLFPVVLVGFKRHLSASLKKSSPPKTNQKTQTKKKTTCEMEKGCFNEMSQMKVFSPELCSLMSQCGWREERKGQMFWCF